ncbi:hypothetical protein DFA_04759 [Cavenderia fasciculata]|uniref:Uncharacterized protein n=1 Tax=Cavenderia fasciculata TaxID=261658 RepID=F4PQG6_CACFS|nr:uncharacterized protein DFA_04759 [Cavenderia fasciculata]EGG22629.1 hypothetical protein DFA_04759 [Cavenderia fasciculata]|eukprot:XP_004360480.1 hypothetical protein DFA_04759 [Cavenderia fasciculata]
MLNISRYSSKQTSNSLLYYYTLSSSSGSSGSYIVTRDYSSGNNNRDRSKNIIKGLNYKSIGNQQSKNKTNSYRLADDTIISHKITSRGGPKKYLDQGFGWDNVTFHQGDISAEKLRDLQEEGKDLIDYNRNLERKREIRQQLRKDSNLSKNFKGLRNQVNQEEEEEEEEKYGSSKRRDKDEEDDEDDDEDEDEDEIEDDGQDEDEKDPTKLEFGKMKSKTFVKEDYIIMKPDQKDDESFVRKQMQDDGFESELAQDDGWREYDEKKGGVQADYSYKDEEAKSLAKKGLTKESGSLYCQGFKIDEKYLKYFMDPNHIEGGGRRGGLSRKERKKLKAKEEMAMSGKTERPRKERKVIFDEENDEEHTILQKKMANRIMSLLNESVIFKDHNTRYHSMIADYQHDPTKQSMFGFFKNQKDAYMEEDELFDPVLSKVHIVLTKTKVSSDLKWLKVYWARDSDNIDNNVDEAEEMELEGIDEEKEEMEEMEEMDEDEEGEEEDENGVNVDEEIEMEEIEDEDEDDLDEDYGQDEEHETRASSTDEPVLNDILDDLSTFKAKQIMIKRLRDTLPDEEISSTAQTHGLDNIVLSKSFRTSSLQQQKQQQQQQQQDYNNKEAFSFGKFGNEVGSEGVEFQVKIPSFDERLTVSTPKVGNDEDLKAAQRRKIAGYEAITDEQIQNRLVKLTPRLRMYIAKNMKSRYVPNLYFILDKDKKKQEASIDIFENVIAPEMLEAAKQSRSRQIEKSKQLTNKFMGVFNNSPQQQQKQATVNMKIPGYSPENEDSLYMDGDTANDVIRTELLGLGYKDFNDPYEKQTPKPETKEESLSKQFIHKKFTSLQPPIKQPTPPQPTREDKEAEANKQFFKDFNKGIFKK